MLTTTQMGSPQRTFLISSLQLQTHTKSENKLPSNQPMASSCQKTACKPKHDVILWFGLLGNRVPRIKAGWRGRVGGGQLEFEESGRFSWCLGHFVSQLACSERRSPGSAERKETTSQKPLQAFQLPHASPTWPNTYGGRSAQLDRSLKVERSL